MLCGGLESHSVDDKVKEVTLKVKKDAEEKLQTSFDVFEPVESKTQVVRYR
jgi:hypothetical protein